MPYVSWHLSAPGTWIWDQIWAPKAEWKYCSAFLFLVRCEAGFSSSALDLSQRPHRSSWFLFFPVPQRAIHNFSHLNLNTIAVWTSLFPNRILSVLLLRRCLKKLTTCARSLTSERLEVSRYCRRCKGQKSPDSRKMGQEAARSSRSINQRAEVWVWNNLKPWVERFSGVHLSTVEPHVDFSFLFSVPVPSFTFLFCFCVSVFSKSPSPPLEYTFSVPIVF